MQHDAQRGDGVRRRRLVLGRHGDGARQSRLSLTPTFAPRAFCFSSFLVSQLETGPAPDVLWRSTEPKLIRAEYNRNLPRERPSVEMERTQSGPGLTSSMRSRSRGWIQRGPAHSTQISGLAFCVREPNHESNVGTRHLSQVDLSAWSSDPKPVNTPRTAIRPT